MPLERMGMPSSPLLRGTPLPALQVGVPSLAPDPVQRDGDRAGLRGGSSGAGRGGTTRKAHTRPPIWVPRGAACSGRRENGRHPLPANLGPTTHPSIYICAAIKPGTTKTAFYLPSESVTTTLPIRKCCGGGSGSSVRHFRSASGIPLPW